MRLAKPVSKTAFFFLFFLFGLFGALAFGASESESTYRGEISDLLHQRKFIRDATCEQLTEWALAQAGLPPIGKDEPVLGTRGDMDRELQYDRPPHLLDSVVRTTKPYRAYTVKTYPNPLYPTVWYLELREESGATSAQKSTVTSKFEFRLGSAGNHPSCDLMAIYFTGPDPKLAGEYDADRCLDLFAPAQSASSPEPESPFRASVEKSCALGLRFFLALKWPR